MDEYDEGFEYFYITSDRFVDGVEPNEKDEYLEQRRKTFGNYFKTRDEAGDCLSYLKARATIKQDAKGFKPDWEDKEQPKYYGYWNFKEHEPEWSVNYITKIANIYFKSYEALEESFEKHPKEWKTYLTYKQ